MPRSTRSSNRSRAVEAIKPTFHQNPWVQFLIAVWRWLPEILLLTGFLSASWALTFYAMVQPWWAAPCILITPFAVLMLIPPVRRVIVAWFWVDVTRHRLRSFMSENGLRNRSWRLPWLLCIYPTPVGETAVMVTVAGISVDDIRERTRNLGSTCYATSGEVEPIKKHGYLFKIHVKRRSVIDSDEPVKSTLVDTKDVLEGNVLPPEADEGSSDWAKHIGLTDVPGPGAFSGSIYQQAEDKDNGNGTRKDTSKKKAASKTSNTSNSTLAAFVSNDGEDISDYL